MPLIPSQTPICDAQQYCVVEREGGQSQAVIPLEVGEQLEKEVNDLKLDNATLMDGYNTARRTWKREMEELEARNEALRTALEPFVQYAIKHGGNQLRGRNGAVITAEDWVRAGELLGTQARVVLANTGATP